MAGKPTWEESERRRARLRKMLDDGPVRLCVVTDLLQVSRVTAIADLRRLGAVREGYAPRTSWSLPRAS